MVPLHPELARLEEQYNQLLDQVEAHNITFDNAKDTLAQLVVVDGNGAQWGMNVDGDFVCAASPDTAPVPADPARFVPPQLPQRAGPAQPPWASSGDLMAPPVGVGGQAAPVMPVTPVSYEPAIPQASHLPDDEPGRKPKRGLPSVPAGGIGDVISRNKRMIIIGVICVAVLGFIAMRGGEEAPDAVPGTTVPGETTLPGEPSTPLPTDAPGTETTTAPPAEPAAVPNADEVAAGLANLISGDRGLVSRTVSGLSTDSAIAVTTASFAGIERAGLSIRPNPPAQSDQGADQTLDLVDNATGTVYATATITWVRGPDNAWVMATAPAFTLN